MIGPSPGEFVVGAEWMRSRRVWVPFVRWFGGSAVFGEAPSLKEALDRAYAEAPRVIEQMRAEAVAELPLA